MTAALCLPEDFKLVQLASPETTNAGKTSDVITLKHAHKAWIIIELTQAVAHATAFALRQATDVAAGTNAAGPSVPIWANEDCGATDTLVRQTAAASYTVTADVKDKTIVFEVDPALLTAGYDCVYVTAANSGQATDLWSVTAVLQERYHQATPPSAIVD